jgi:hypothetical protein
VAPPSGQKPLLDDGSADHETRPIQQHHAKRERIAAGSKEKMRKPGAPGAPTAKAFKESAKTAKKK